MQLLMLLLEGALDFEVVIGGLILAIKRQDNAFFEYLIQKTRAEIMGVLSAASMESYQRAYPYITKLHMLHGITHFKNNESQCHSCNPLTFLFFPQN